MTTEEEETRDEDYVIIHESDLLKISNALRDSHSYFEALNTMNASLHREDPVFSPLTVSTKQAYERIDALLLGINSKRTTHEQDVSSND